MPVTLADLEIVYFDPKKHDVAGFDCDDLDLNDFLKNDAWKYQADHISHTRLAFLGKDLVGYVTLLADCVILQTREKKRALKEAKEFHQTVLTFPAVKIGRLGVQREYQRSGVGTQLLKYVVGLVVRLNRDLNIGCRLITLDAYPKSVSWYEKKGFVFNEHYGRRRQRMASVYKFFLGLAGKTPKRKHPSMRYDILRSREIT